MIWLGNKYGRELEVADAIFRAAHAEGNALCDPDVVIDCGVAGGFSDRKEVAAFLEGERGCSDVAGAQMDYLVRGVSAVPVRGAERNSERRRPFSIIFARLEGGLRPR